MVQSLKRKTTIQEFSMVNGLALNILMSMETSILLKFVEAEAMIEK